MRHSKKQREQDRRETRLGNDCNQSVITRKYVSTLSQGSCVGTYSTDVSVVFSFSIPAMTAAPSASKLLPARLQVK